MTKENKKQIVCPNCKSQDIWKQGYRINKIGKKQKYRCSECKRYFVLDDGFKRMRFDPEIITRAIHMYNDGLSVSKVQNHLFQHDSIKVSDVSILNWIKKYATVFKKGKTTIQTNNKKTVYV